MFIRPSSNHLILLLCSFGVAACAGKTTAPHGDYINGEAANDYYQSLTYGQDPVTHKYKVLTSTTGIKPIDSSHLLYANMTLYLMSTQVFTNAYSECSVDSSVAAAPCTATGQSTEQTGNWSVSGDDIVLDHLGSGQNVTANGADGFVINSLQADVMTAGLAGEPVQFIQTLQATPGP